MDGMASLQGSFCKQARAAFNSTSLLSIAWHIIYNSLQHSFLATDHLFSGPGDAPNNSKHYNVCKFSHSRLPPSLLTPSLNTYPSATGLPPLMLPSPYGDLINLSVKN